MTENQNREWKASWRDEYLKWICGFANAQGGVVEIGRNDAGEPVGVANAAKRHKNTGMWVGFTHRGTEVGGNEPGVPPTELGRKCRGRRRIP